MKISDLKNGMMLYTRSNNKKYYIVVNEYIYSGCKGCNLTIECTLQNFIKKYDDDFNYTYCNNKDKDIIKILDITGKPIWTRTDWSKVPIDTKVLVKDYDNNNWVKRHYAGYDEGKDLFKAFTDGGTSWTTKDTTEWLQCKLEDEEDNKKVSANEINEEFSEFCQKSFPHCRNCKYDMDNLYKIKWILDTYNLTKK